MDLTILYNDSELDEQRRIRKLLDRIERLERAGRDATALLAELSAAQDITSEAA